MTIMSLRYCKVNLQYSVHNSEAAALCSQQILIYA